MHHVQDQRSFIKCAYKGRVYIGRNTYTHGLCLSNWKWKYVLSSALYKFLFTLWLLNFHYHNNKNRPIFDNFRQLWKWNKANHFAFLHFYHFLLKGAARQKKWSFQLRISSVNVTKYTGNCGFGHIYWKDPWFKNSFFVQCSLIFKASKLFQIQ